MSDPITDLHRPAPLPADEAARLARLRGLHVLDTEAEAIFDTIAKTAADLCGMPIALVCLIDADRQWFKATHGITGLTGTPRDIAFCAHLLATREAIAVPDMRCDPRFARNPLVTGPTALRAYAGAPIVLSDGFVIGGLCVVDRAPRTLATNQLQALDGLARTAARAFESRERAAVAVADAEAANARITHLYRATPAPLFSMDTQGRLLIVSDTWLSETGYTREEIEGKPVFDYLTPESRHFSLNTGMPTFLREGRTVNHEYQVIHKNGSVMDVLVSQTLERDADGNPLRSMSVFENITRRKKAEADLARSRELLQVTLDSIGDGVITTDLHGAVQWLNPVAERMTGWRKGDVVGENLSDVYVIVDEATRRRARNPVADCLARNEIVDKPDRLRLISRDGTEYGIEDSASPIRDTDGKALGAVLVFRDVSEQRRMHDEMSHRATHDPLTGLINRTEFEGRLQELLATTEDDGLGHTLLYIDLDQFKIVNDACGHGAGDLLLRQVAELLRACVRATDTVARLGGDEFGLVLEQCDGASAQRVAQKICDQMEAYRFTHEGRRFRVGTSIGLVPVDARWASVKALLQAADASCYAAKEGGRNRVHAWFDSDASLKARHGDMQWVTRLELALDEDRFELFAQRIAPIAAGGDDGAHFEVLLRLREPNGALIAPGAFLPAAERFHLATRLDRWVVRKAFAVMDIATRRAIDVSMMAINLSGQSLGDRAFHRDVAEMIRQASFDVRRLCFEITETAAITHLADARAFIDEVRALGVKIALDDFGAGASSFGYLKSLPVDFLKIDGHFVTTLLEDALNDAAVRCFVDVAKVVGVKTIAEFVEREDVRDALGAIGVDMAQGYLVHKPEPLAALLACLPEAAVVD